MTATTKKTSKSKNARTLSKPFPVIVFSDDLTICPWTNTVQVCHFQIPSLWHRNGITIGFHLLRDFFNDYLTTMYESNEKNAVNQWKHFLHKDLFDHAQLSQQATRTKDDCWILMTWEEKQNLWNDYLATYENRYDLTQSYRVIEWCYSNLYNVMLKVFGHIGNGRREKISWVDTKPFAVLQHVITVTEYLQKMSNTP